MTVRYARSAERPALKLWLSDDDGSLIDFSSGYTFSFKVGTPGTAALLTKTSGIAGAVGAGTEPTGTPNVLVTWTGGELNLTPGTYSWQLTATTSSLDRVFQGTFVILDVIT
jgi:hypothetical protein